MSLTLLDISICLRENVCQKGQKHDGDKVRSEGKSERNNSATTKAREGMEEVLRCWSRDSPAAGGEDHGVAARGDRRQE